MSPDDRRPFRGAPFERGRGDRPAGPGGDRGDRPPMDRPGFVAQRPFVRPPTRGGDMPPPDHSVRIRDGEREIEVRGNPAFVRQVLDDLPALMSRLRGEAPGRTTISMPAPPAAPAVDGAAAASAEPTALAEVTRSGPDEVGPGGTERRPPWPAGQDRRRRAHPSKARVRRCCAAAAGRWRWPPSASASTVPTSPASRFAGCSSVPARRVVDVRRPPGDLLPALSSA